MPFIKPQPVPELLPPSNRYNDLRDTFRRVGFDVVKRAFQSSNFVTGSAGWRITAEGDFEGSSGTFRGAIAATSGTIAIEDTGPFVGMGNTGREDDTLLTIF